MEQTIADRPLIYDVVINFEGQYSIWLVKKDIPQGWTKVGHQGDKSSCLDYINQNWVDMRPNSLLKSLTN